MQLEDWLDDLCVRFIINLPNDELESVERICFQVEEAQWFYEDFIRPQDPQLPSLNLRAFSLRIFQHCEFFSTWSAQTQQAAFADFLAYKQRVPVRGAIMLNETMDEVVLVKGWKKGANWSFPRGKINKEEDDLDCAVREVYEETGYDIQAAGLVKEAKDMKYIEVTMREQHMRLYVFRGVPKDTYFEPRTRKEISRIEWYKLTDLPTLKRHKHQDSSGDALAVHANKFYMVAPFLGPLKKWIAQQRKLDDRRSSQAAYLAPAPVEEEIVTEEEASGQGEPQRPELQTVTSHGPSDLPEVSISQSEALTADPSSHLKRLLNINISPLGHEPNSPIVTPVPKTDPAKSSALLALLRGGSTAELRAGPSTPSDQTSFPLDLPSSLHRQHPRPPPVPSMAPHPFQVPRDQNQYNHQRRPDHIQSSGRQPQFDAFSGRPQVAYSALSTETMPDPAHFSSQNMVAPYIRTGDRDRSYQQFGESQQSSAPPASALPKLTNHTKALLDAFKASPTITPINQSHSIALLTDQTQPHSAKIGSGILPGQPETSMPIQHPTTNAERSVAGAVDTSRPNSILHRPKSNQQASLLDLFRQPSSSNTLTLPNAQQPVLEKPPAELATISTSDRMEKKLTANNDLLSLLTRESETSKHQAKKRGAKVVGEGETSATINGPLNQPHFDGILKTRKYANDNLARSPVAADRTLFDPNQPTPVKILARPDDGSRRSPGRSPRMSKPAVPSSSPRRLPTTKEQPKPFQPQILRRPQTGDSQTNTIPITPITGFGEKPAFGKQDPPKSAVTVAARPSASPSITRQSPGVETQRQTLLSLFGKTPSAAEGPVTPRDHQGYGDLVSPLSASQLATPQEEKTVQSIEPFSTRSRVGSLASITSSNIRPTSEKRQTAAGDKAFLLGYLGRIASKEG